MNVRFRCGSCGTSVQVDSSHAGKRAKCPKCGTVLQIPMMDKIAAAQPKQSGAAVAPAPAPSNVAAQQPARRDIDGLSDFAPRFDADDFDVEPPAPLPTETQPPPLPSYYRQPEPEAPVRYAGFWKRAAALVIDYILALFGLIVFGFVVGIIAAINGGDEEAIEALSGLFDIVAILGFWLYFALMEASVSQGTLGKMALGIKVVDLNGQQIGFGRATGRHFAKILSGLSLCIGYIMAGFTPKKQALHDMIAGCLVVNR